MTNKNIILSVNNLHVEVAGKKIVKGVSLQIKAGEKHALMGKNGSGKSSLANALAGHPNYKITSGSVTMDGQDLLEMNATERSLAGLFLGFQYPMTIPGVTVANFLRAAIKARNDNGNGNGTDMKNFRKIFKEKMKLLKIDSSFATRYLNDGFSGGEKKRLEILQMAMLEPKVAILDETDSGLDIDALKVVANGIIESAPKDSGVILVTHYQRLLNYIKPDQVHIMIDGRIIKSGGPELALELEASGYEKLEAELSQKVGV